MVIEKVHGLQATCISLNDRFTMLATSAPDPVTTRQRQRRTSVGSFINQNLNYKNRNLIEQIARRLEQQAKRRALRHRLGMPLRRFGSDGNLPSLQRSNSFGNLSQSQNIKNRVSWRQSNGNLSRSASFNNLAGGAWRGRQLRGYRRRGGGQRALRGRFGGGRQSAGRVTRVPQRRGGARGAGRGVRGASRGVGRGRGAGTAGRGAGRGAGSAGRGASGAHPNRGQAMRGRGRGGITRIQNPKPVPTKEELDDQLDQYMASCKSTLDKELDAYMKNAMELE